MQSRNANDRSTDENKAYFRIIFGALVVQIIGVITMGLTDHFSLKQIEKEWGIVKPQHDEMWYTHRSGNRNSGIDSPTVSASSINSTKSN